MPEELPRNIKGRAAEHGTSRSDHPLAEVEEIAGRPTLSERMDRLDDDDPMEIDEPPEVTIRRLRGAG